MARPESSGFQQPHPTCIQRPRPLYPTPLSIPILHGPRWHKFWLRKECEGEKEPGLRVLCPRPRPGTTAGPSRDKPGPCPGGRLLPASWGVTCPPEVGATYHLGRHFTLSTSPSLFWYLMLLSEGRLHLSAVINRPSTQCTRPDISRK